MYKVNIKILSWAMNMQLSDQARDPVPQRPASLGGFRAMHRAEPQLAVSLLAEILDTIDDAFCVCDATGRIHHENQPFRELITRNGDLEAIRSEARRLACTAVRVTFRHNDPARNDGPAGRVSEVSVRGLSYRLRASLLRQTESDLSAAALVSLEVVGGVTIAEHVRVAHRLTPREAQVVELLAEGHSNRRVAEELGVSTHTARHHTGRVLSKLQARGRAEVGAMIRRLQG